MLQSTFWRSFGPGLMWAAAAIGVSHLVQSTRAGAGAGFGLSGIILLAILFKYPFFEYGPRYAAATGKSLVEGYCDIGKWALWLYFGITVVTSLIVQAAIVLFTSFLLNFTFGIDLPLPLMGALLYAGCASLLGLGRFRVLDGVVKGIIAVLAVSTLAAAAVALQKVDLSSFSLGVQPVLERTVSWTFVLALVGWMPSAVDVAVWSSLWTLAKDTSAGIRTSVKTARLDFLIGYGGTAVLAFAFLTLGATVMFGAGQTFSPQGTVFSTQLADLYSRMLGAWTRPVVIIAIVTTMVSTSLTVIDGFPRAIERSIEVLKASRHSNTVDDIDPVQMGRVYWLALSILAILTVLVLALFVGNLTTMIDSATVVSFLTAPVLGYLNLRAVTSKRVKPQDRPGRGLRALSYIGLVLLGGTGIIYTVSLF